MADEDAAASEATGDEREGAIKEVEVELYAVLGQATMLVSQLLKIGRGAIIELDQRTSDPVELQVNQELIAYGEIVTVDDKLGVTITDVVKKQFS
jgi:flagellar motor switch protein FliN/FliY